MVLAEAAPKSTTCSSNESESNLENVPDANEAKRVKNTKESPKKGNSRQQSIKSKRGKRKVSHFGDENFSIETNQGVATRLTLLDEDKVSREEIYQSCCIHTSWEWARILAGVVALLVCLYFFCFGLQLMGNASKVMAGCASGELFGSNTNPLSSLMVGIISTVLLQSSTAAVAVIVALEEANAMSVQAGIFMVMGANIGTTITSALVTLGQLRNRSELERGVAAASVHSLFNFLTVVVLFPIEWSFGYLQAVTRILVDTAETGGREESYVGPIKRIVQPLVDKIIISNSRIITGVAKGKSCDAYYPIHCDPDFEPSHGTCKVGLIACDKSTGSCPLFFRKDATIFEDKLSGGLTFLLALGVIVLSTMGLIVAIKFLLDGLSVRVVHAVTRCNGYFGILLGGVVTVLAQSSQVVVSTLVPFAGVGALPLETIYPIVVGSNIGTALQTVMTSLTAFGSAPLQVALSHLFFNVTGSLLWYPLPHLRSVPLRMARYLGQCSSAWRLFPIASILVSYLVVPFCIYGLAELYETERPVAQVFAILLFIASVMGLVTWAAYWFWWSSTRATTSDNSMDLKLPVEDNKGGSDESIDEENPSMSNPTSSSIPSKHPLTSSVATSTNTEWTDLDDIVALDDDTVSKRREYIPSTYRLDAPPESNDTVATASRKQSSGRNNGSHFGRVEV